MAKRQKLSTTSFMKYCTTIINIFHKHVVKWITNNSIETNKLHVDFWAFQFFSTVLITASSVNNKPYIAAERFRILFL